MGRYEDILIGATVVLTILLLLAPNVNAYAIFNNSVTYSNSWGSVTQYPHTLNDFENIAYVNVTSNISGTINLDTAFGFDTANAKPLQAWYWQTSAPHTVPAERLYNESITITCGGSSAGIIDNNNVWCYYPGNSTNQTLYCPSPRYFPNSMSCVYNNTKVDYNTITTYYDDWVDISNRFASYGNIDGKTWYVIENVSWTQGQNRQLKARIAVKAGKSGKYDIRIKRSSDSWADAINGYVPNVYLDPWFSNNFTIKTMVHYNSTAPQSLTQFPFSIQLNTSSLIAANKMRSDCGDLRIVNSSEDGLLPYIIENGTCNTGNTTVWIRAPIMPNGILNGQSNFTFYIYYNWSSGTSAEQMCKVFTNNFTAVYLMDTFADGATVSGSQMIDYACNKNATINGTTGIFRNFNGAMFTKGTGNRVYQVSTGAGTNHMAIIPNPNVFAGGAFTISARTWFNTTGATSQNIIVGTSDLLAGALTFHRNCDDAACPLSLSGDQGGTHLDWTAASNNTWVYVAAIGASATTGNTTENGTTQKSGSVGTIGNGNSRVYIGRTYAFQGGAYDVAYFRGYIDDLKISSVSRNNAWLIAEAKGTYTIYGEQYYATDSAPTVNAVNLTNGSTGSYLGTLYYQSNALNCSANVTDNENATIKQVLFSVYRNSTLYTWAITYDVANNTISGMNGTQIWVASSALRKSDTWRCEASAYDGTNNATGLNSSAFTVNNTAPVVTPNPLLNNTNPKTGEVLLCSPGTYSDTDNDPGGTIYYRWWKNGVVQAGQTASTLDLTAISAVGGDKINCSSNQSDTGYSAFNSTEKYSTQATVQTTPIIATTNLTYADTSTIYTLYTMQGLNCSFTVVDNDTATTNVTVRWYDSVDGVVGSHTVTNVANNTLTWATQAFGAVSGQLYKGRNYWCAVSATDGAYTTAYNASPQYTVNNTAPVIGSPSINNTNPTNTSIILCTNGTFTDVDYIYSGSPISDPVNNSAGSWRWFKNGIVVTGNTTQNVSLGTSGLNTSNGDIIICERTAYDSYYSPKASDAKNSTPVTVGAVGVPSISLCSVSGFPVLNFTLWDEETLASVTGSMEATFTLYNTTDMAVISNASFTITNSSYFAFCINQYAVTVYVDSFQAYYTSLALGEYDQRDYFLLKAFLNASNPQTIPIYLENATYSKQTQIFIRDETGKGLDGIYLAMQRYYPGTNEYKIVAMSKTNNQGYAVTYLRPNDPYYRPIAYRQDGTVIQAFTSAFIPCDPGATTCTLNLQVTPQVFGYYWQYYGKVAHNCTNVNASGTYYIACSFIDTSGLSQNISLVVKQIGAPTTTICTNTTYSQSGVLICYLPSATAKYSYSLEMNINPFVILENGDIVYVETMTFGTFGLFLAMILVFTMAFAGLWLGSPPITIAFTLFGVILAWVSGVMVIGITAMASIIVLGVFIIYLSRRS